MTRKLRFTKTELVNAAKIAVEHNVSVRLTADGDVIIQPSEKEAEALEEIREPIIF